MPALYSTLQLHYDSYLFHHRGWISHYKDITYSSSQWDKEILDVYIVPFSHQDPGVLKPHPVQVDIKVALVAKVLV